MNTATSIADTKAAVHYSTNGPEPHILFHNEQLKVIVAGLAAGQQIPEHPEALAVYHFLEGKGQMTVNGETITVSPGATVVTPAGSTRGVFAETQLSFLAARVAQ
ncbi:MAG: cupin domain-containing protein [Chloroflexota bacterium]